MKGQDKKIDIVRNNVIKNVKIYSSQLAGHYYLYIFENQLFFNKRFPLPTAMKKSDNLKDLGKFIVEGYFVIKDLVTQTCVYPYAITN